MESHFEPVLARPAEITHRPALIDMPLHIGVPKADTHRVDKRGLHRERLQQRQERTSQTGAEAAVSATVPARVPLY
jgi:hypothetical protein